MALLPSEPSRAAELADRLLACGLDEHRAIREALRPHRSVAAPRLRVALDAETSDPGRRVRAAAALIALDDPDSPGSFAAAELAWERLRAAEVPDSRVELLDWLVRSRIRPETLLARLATEPDPSVRRSVIQVLAELDDGGHPPAAISASWTARLAAIYREDPDPGVHSSLSYLFLRWGLATERAGLDAGFAGKPPGRRGWFVNAIGQTLAIVGPVESTNRRLAMATTETTLGQFLRFDPGHRARAEPAHGSIPDDPDLPAGAVSFDEAARFCNWLSREDGLPTQDWCYLPGETPGTMLLAPDYLFRRGYRLPTLREWELAARAGTTADRYFGRLLRYAGSYSWYNRNTDNHAEPVGHKRPNDLGLFDALGNLLEWCQNPDPPHDLQCDCPAARGAECRKVRFVSVRGGSFSQPEGGLTVAGYSPSLDRLFPGEAFRYIGFRVVRMVP